MAAAEWRCGREARKTFGALGSDTRQQSNPPVRLVPPLALLAMSVPGFVRSGQPFALSVVVLTLLLISPLLWRRR